LRGFCSDLPFPGFTEDAFVSWGSHRGREVSLEERATREKKKMEKKKKKWGQKA
jgi:hypothetical protein